jgi:putative transposase
MSELLSLVIHAARAAVRGRTQLILENLLLRHQLQVALRPKRRLSLRRRDRFLWVLVRKLRPDWRRYLLYVRPETVIRWHRSGWPSTLSPTADRS